MACIVSLLQQGQKNISAPIELTNLQIESGIFNIAVEQGGERRFFINAS